ncbi:MAG: Flp pilus assembly protein CpaB [Pseudomonadota bacterium]|nr:Flp pilus assembly protein CpaB [Pseudomonadota bacterium]
MKTNNKNSIILLICALAAGAGGWYLSSNHIQNEISSYKSSFESEREAVDVVVAKRDLAVGDELNTSTASVRKIPRIYVPAEAIMPSQFSGIQGRQLIHPIRAGEPILALHVSQVKVDGLASLLREGERAITLPVSQLDTFSGFLAPGDYVDLMITLKDGATKRTVPLAQNLRVLATGTDLDDGIPEKKKARYSEITVGVSPLYATRLIHAQTVGDISLLLRRPEDETDRFEDYVTLDNLVDIPNEVKVQAPPPTPPKQEPWGFEVIRGGKRS